MKPQTTACCSAALFQSPCGKDLGCASLTLRSLPVAPCPFSQGCVWDTALPHSQDLAAALASSR